MRKKSYIVQVERVRDHCYNEDLGVTSKVEVY
jgi:hypothetical protein